MDLRHPLALSIAFCLSHHPHNQPVSRLSPCFVRGTEAPGSVCLDEALWASNFAPHDRYRVDSALHHFCWLATPGRRHSLLPGLGGVQPHCAVIPPCSYTEQGIRLPCLHLLFFFFFYPPHPLLSFPLS